MAQGRDWAISDGNAGTGYPSFYSSLNAGVAAIDWDAVRTDNWQGRITQKMAEFLIADWFPWSGFETIGCMNSTVAGELADILRSAPHQPKVMVERGWYY